MNIYFNEYIKQRIYTRENKEHLQSQRNLDFKNFDTLQTTENLPLCQQIQCISGFKKKLQMQMRQLFWGLDFPVRTVDFFRAETLSHEV